MKQIVALLFVFGLLLVAMAVAQDEPLFRVIPNNNLNLRACATTECDRVGQVQAGTELPVYAVEGDWYQVQVDGELVWVAGWLTTRAPDKLLETKEFYRDSNTGCDIVIAREAGSTRDLAVLRSGAYRREVQVNVFLPDSGDALRVQGRFDDTFTDTGDPYILQYYSRSVNWPNGLYRIEVSLGRATSIFGWKWWEYGASGGRHIVRVHCGQAAAPNPTFTPRPTRTPRPSVTPRPFRNPIGDLDYRFYIPPVPTRPDQNLDDLIVEDYYRNYYFPALDTGTYNLQAANQNRALTRDLWPELKDRPSVQDTDPEALKEIRSIIAGAGERPYRTVLGDLIQNPLTDPGGELYPTVTRRAISTPRPASGEGMTSTQANVCSSIAALQPDLGSFWRDLWEANHRHSATDLGYHIRFSASVQLQRFRDRLPVRWPVESTTARDLEHLIDSGALNYPNSGFYTSNLYALYMITARVAPDMEVLLAGLSHSPVGGTPYSLSPNQQRCLSSVERQLHYLLEGNTGSWPAGVFGMCFEDFFETWMELRFNATETTQSIARGFAEVASAAVTMDSSIENLVEDCS